MLTMRRKKGMLLMLAGRGRRSFLSSFDFSRALADVMNPAGVLTRVQQMAFRTSPLAAPFGSMLPVQSNAAGTAGDVLSYGRGTQVSGVNYDTVSMYQGTMGILLEPLWAGNDSKLRSLWIAGGGVSLQKPVNNNLQTAFITSPFGGVATSLAASTLLTRYAIFSRWDVDNVVSGAVYNDLWVNGTQYNGTTSAPTLGSPAATIYLGCNGAVQQEQALEYGRFAVDYSMSAAELAAIYGTGTWVSPDRVILDPTGIKFLWLPGARAASGAIAGAVTNEACFWNQRPYNVSTNPNGNWIVNGRFEAAFGAEWVASANAVLTQATSAIYLVGMADAACMVITNNGATNQNFVQTVLAAAGTSFYFSALAATIDGTSADIAVYSGTAGAPVTTTLFNSTNATTTAARASASFSVGAGHDRLTFVFTNTGASTKSARFDNVGLWLNKATNGGFEGVFAKTGAAISNSATLAVVTANGGASYTITAAGAWGLSLTEIGMILYGETGTEVGYITAFDDSLNTVTADFAAGAPANLQAFGVYSALAPGWTAGAGIRCYRSTNPVSGTYAQGLTNTSGGTATLTSTILSTSIGTWYMTVFKARVKSGAGNIRYLGLGSPRTVTGISTSYVQITEVNRATTVNHAIQIYADNTAAVVEYDDLAVVPLDSITLTATAGGRSESDGTNILGGDTNKVPGAGVINALNGSIAFKFTTRGWHGGDGREHMILDTTMTGGRIIIAKDPANNLYLQINDAAGGAKYRYMAVTSSSMPTEAVTLLGVSWSDSGGLHIVLNGVGGALDSGAGTGILAVVPTTVAFGSHATSDNIQIDANMMKVKTFKVAKEVPELIQACLEL